jgi:hypothetical protein
MRKSIACLFATAVVSASALNVARAGLLPLEADAMRAAERTEVIGVHYHGSDFIAGAAIGFVGVFDLTNPCYPCDCGCYRTYPHYYYHRFHFPDRFYHPRYGYRTYY